MWQEKKIQNQFSVHDQPSSNDCLGTLENFTFFRRPDQTRQDKLAFDIFLLIFYSLTIELLGIWVLRFIEGPTV